MSSVNRVHFLGRLTRDPESKTFANGGKVTQIGLAVTGQRKKNPSTGQWEEEPCFLDCKAFNSEKGRKTADILEQYFRKGSRIYIDGHLVMEQWQDKQSGGNRTAIRVVIDDLQFIDQKSDGGSAPAKKSEPAGDPFADGGSTDNHGYGVPSAGSFEETPF